MSSNTDKPRSNFETFEPDYIIVGAGAGGGVLAARLAEDKNIKVLLIEAGPDNTQEAAIVSAASWFMTYDLPDEISPGGSPTCLAFETVPQKGKKYGYPRGSGLGGSTNHHAMVDGRGSEAIYDHWADLLGDSSWSGESLRHYFKKMENYDVPEAKKEAHGQDGWLHIKQGKLREEIHHDLISAAKDLFDTPFRHDFYDDPKDASGIGALDSQVHNDGRRSYVATDLLLPRYHENKQNGWNNLEILTDKLVTKVIFEGKRAVGVEVIDGAHAFQVDSRHKPESRSAPRIIYKAKKEVIICGGSINTPQTLMLSGIGPKAHLEKLGIPVIKDAPGVGQNLQDHMEIALIYEMNNLPNKVWRGQASLLSLTDPKWAPYAETDSLSENGIPMVWEWFSDFDVRDKRHPDLHIHIFHAYFRDFNTNPLKFSDPDPLKASSLHKTMSAFNTESPGVFLQFLTEIVKVEANSGTIMLASTDPTESPIIDLRLNMSDSDLTRLALGVQRERELMNHPNIQQYQPVEVLPGPDFQTLEETKDYISRYSAFGHHISGTAKMGKSDDPMAVVDTNLKVIGVEGLRVCDASIFPTIPGFNTSRPSYMVGEVLADKIKAGK